MKVVITYFKASGKYYAEGDYETAKEPLFEIWNEVEEMFARGVRPGLVDCKPGEHDFHATVDVPDHPYRHPHMIVCEGLELRQLVQEAHETSISKGWWENELIDPAGHRTCDRLKVVDEIPTKICLLHSEASEMLEDYRRDGDRVLEQGRQDSTGKPIGFDSEAADVAIRLFDLVGALGLDLYQAIRRKMAFNKTRSLRHGGKRV